MTGTKINLWAVYLLAAAPFYSNDLFYLGGTDYPQFVAVDYVSRVLSLLVIFWLVKQKLPIATIGFGKISKDKLLSWTLVILFPSIILALESTVKWKYLPPLPGLIPEFSYDCDSTLYFWDYHFGLILVAISEEIVARGLALSASKQLGIPIIGSFILSPLLFAAFHWGNPPWDILAAFIFGVLFMIPTYRTGNIIPAIIAHCCANWIMLAC